MSRRPSSITLTADNATILCADKFGDVYALPLIPSPDDERPETSIVPEPVETTAEEKDYTPSASILTVHSGRNRKALENQMRQKAKGPPKPKEVITFKHELLLGHVSMLTDLVYAKIGDRGYIITADRDEHVRVSREPPQAHIIEGFCHGHDDFVSKLCIMGPGSLVSGGGDAHLYVWDWEHYQLLKKLHLRDTVLQFLKSSPELGSAVRDDASFKIAVSGIWAVPNGNTKVSTAVSRRVEVAKQQQSNEILVACEGVPALFNFVIDAASTRGTPIPLHGNALDVAFIQTSQSSWTVVVSVDNVHKPGSTTTVRGEQVCNRMRLNYKMLIVHHRTYHGCSASRDKMTARGTRMQAWLKCLLPSPKRETKKAWRAKPITDQCETFSTMWRT